MVTFLSRFERQALAGSAICVVILAVLHEVVQLRELSNAIQTQLVEDYYVTLHVKDTATKQELQTAFKRATAQLNARPQDEESQMRRAKVAAAYEVLSDPKARDKYDYRRRLVRLAGSALSGSFAGVPCIIALFLLYRILSPLMRGRVDPRSFEGQLAGMFAEIECTVQVCLQKSGNEPLGMHLQPRKRGPGLDIQSVEPGGLVDVHNQRARATATSVAEADGGAGHVWWNSTELRAGDILASVNGQTAEEAMMSELRSASSFDLSVQRPLKGLLPWVTEAELGRAGPDERWGCQLTPSKDGSSSMEVAGMDAAGPLSRWNRANPSLQIRTGDRVVAVNREHGVNRMLELLRDSSTTSTWFVVRGVLPDGLLNADASVGPFQKREGEKLGIRIGRVLETPVRGHVIEPGANNAMVVKDVVKGFLVDEWNRRNSGPQVTVGATVLAVNGRTNPTAFAAELSKPSVLLQLRPPRGATAALASASSLPPAAQARGGEAPASRGQQSLVMAEEVPLARRIFGRWAPSLLLPRAFEARLRESLSQMNCEFSVELTRSSDGAKVGLRLEAERDTIGGLDVKQVQPEGLVGRYNRTALEAKLPQIREGDRLICVNEVTAPRLMIEVLSNTSVDKLMMHFSRKAAHAAPGVWEAEVERHAHEGWGMELREHKPKTAAGPCALRVESIAPGGAVERWNGREASEVRWAIEPGDFLVACEPDVSASQILERLRSSQRVRITLLRWHAGPAPEDPSAPQSREAGMAVHVFDVVLERTSGGSERLGIKLHPSIRDPTRTAVEVMLGGLVAKHNQGILEASNMATLEAAAAAQLPVVCPGDELEAVNGERDPSRFPECCSAQKVLLKLSRRSAKPSPASPAVVVTPRSPERTAPPLPAVTLPKQQEANALPAAALPKQEEADALSGWDVGELDGLDLGGKAEEIKPKEAKAAPPAASAAVQAPTPTQPAPVAKPGVQQRPAEPSKVQPPPTGPQSAVQLPTPQPANRAPELPLQHEKDQQKPVDQEKPAEIVTDNKVAAALKKENFLLKSEVDSLRSQLRSGTAAMDELKAMKGEREALQRECSGLQARYVQLEEGSKKEVEVLRAELTELRAREHDMQEKLRQQADLAAANCRLERELSELRGQVQVHATSHPPVPLEALGSLDDTVARLQELSVSLEHVLSSDVGTFR